MVGSRFSVDLDQSRKSGRWNHQVAKQPTSKQEPIRGRWRQAAPRSNVRAPDPNAALEHARSKLSSLEAVLTAMGSYQGPEVDALRSALSKAKQAAQERPLKVQLARSMRSWRGHVNASRKLEEERDAEVELLNVALQRQARLREQVAAEPATTVVNPMTTNPSEEIARLKAKVAQLEAAANHPPRCSVEAAEAVKMRAAKRRAGCVDDSLPNDEQALCEWVDSKMMELRDATDVGDLDSVVALTNLSQGASKMRSATRQPSIVSNMVVS